jgi:hypothetical protein
VVACVAAAADTFAALRADLDALDREAFGGDLLAWRELEPDARPEAPARWSVDATVPGARHLERILARVARPGGTRPLKLVYVDQPVVAADAAGAAWRTPGGDTALRRPLSGARSRAGDRGRARDRRARIRRAGAVRRGQPAMNSLRARLIWGFSLVALVPLSLALALLGTRIRQTMEQQSAVRLEGAIGVARGELVADGSGSLRAWRCSRAIRS